MHEVMVLKMPLVGPELINTSRAVTPLHSQLEMHVTDSPFYWVSIPST